MAKIERKYLAHFINTAMDGEMAVYERLGRDLEEYAPQMSAKVDKKENILGQTNVVISGYAKSARVEPYYAEAGSALFQRLQSIIDGGLVLDALRSDVVEVQLWQTEDGTVFPAVREEVYIEVTSYGGDTSGYQIFFTVHHTGARVSGSFDVQTRTFTAA